MARSVEIKHIDGKYPGDISNDIGMGEWRKGGKPNEKLLTTDATTCIVLAAFNHSSGAGLLGHFSNLEANPRVLNNKEEFDQALAAVSELGNPVDTTVLLSGGAPHIQSGKDTVEVDRNYATKAVKEAGIPADNIKTEWSKEGSAIDVELECGIGKIAIRTFAKFDM